MKLKEIREAAGYTAPQACKLLGIPESQLSKWETGKVRPGFDNLLRLADFYGLTLDQLAGRSPLPASHRAAV